MYRGNFVVREMKTNFSFSCLLAPHLGMGYIANSKKFYHSVYIKIGKWEETSNIDLGVKL